MLRCNDSFLFCITNSILFVLLLESLSPGCTTGFCSKNQFPTNSGKFKNRNWSFQTACVIFSGSEWTWWFCFLITRNTCYIKKSTLSVCLRRFSNTWPFHQHRCVPPVYSVRPRLFNLLTVFHFFVFLRLLIKAHVCSSAVCLYESCTARDTEPTVRNYTHVLNQQKHSCWCWIYLHTIVH